VPGATLEIVLPPYSDGAAAAGPLGCALEELEELPPPAAESSMRRAPRVRRRLEGRLSARSEREEDVVEERVGAGNGP
jgi:hypothetical protein